MRPGCPAPPSRLSGKFCMPAVPRMSPPTTALGPVGRLPCESRLLVCPVGWGGTHREAQEGRDWHCLDEALTSPSLPGTRLRRRPWTTAVPAARRRQPSSARWSWTVPMEARCPTPTHTSRAACARTACAASHKPSRPSRPVCGAPAPGFWEGHERLCPPASHPIPPFPPYLGASSSSGWFLSADIYFLSVRTFAFW